MAGKLRLYHFISSTRAEGPGLRAGLWVQGCPRHCQGCAAPETWDFDGGFDKDVAVLAKEILAVPKLEGVTFAGGEPFCQAGALASLARLLRQGNPALSVICFTGWTMGELLASRDPDKKALLGETDLLIDGPYIESLAENDRPLVGSSNQEFHFLTPRLRDWKKGWGASKHRLEIRISPDGSIAANGMMPGDVLREIVNKIRNGAMENEIL